LIEKIQRHKPKIAVFNGKGIYEIFSKTVFGQKKKDFCFGAQPNKIPGTDTVGELRQMLFSTRLVRLQAFEYRAVLIV